MQEQFVTYEIALSLKELGFDEDCFEYFIDLNDHGEPYFSLVTEYTFITTTRNYIIVPLWQQCLDWFREKHDIHIVITVNPYSEIKEVNGYKIYTNINSTLVCVSNQELQTLRSIWIRILV